MPLVKPGHFKTVERYRRPTTDRPERQTEVRPPVRPPSILKIGRDTAPYFTEPFRRRVDKPSEETVAIDAPVLGLSAHTPPFAQDQRTAVFLENFWPGQTSLTPRGGLDVRAVMPENQPDLSREPIRSMYKLQGAAGADEKFLVFGNTNTYEVDSNLALKAEVTPLFTGFAGPASCIAIQTDASTFYNIVVNGEDNMKMHVPGTGTGTGWIDVTDSGSTRITGIETDKLIWVWAYRNRLFFIEKQSNNAWYLPVNAISGTATKLPLAGIFNKGGDLYFGAVWSYDSGAGLDDFCVFCTDAGEIAVFAGNPADTSWNLQGVFDIGRPLGRAAHLSIGGDLVIATEQGVMPLSGVVKRDPAEARSISLANRIDTIFAREARRFVATDEWVLTKWDQQGMMFLAPTNNDYVYVMNLNTNAWSRFSNWRMSASVFVGQSLLFGSEDGRIWRPEIGGSDRDETTAADQVGQAIHCRGCTSFYDFGIAAKYKMAQMLRGVWTHEDPINPLVTVTADYVYEFPSSPAAAGEAGRATTSAVWDVAIWGIARWGSDGAIERPDLKHLGDWYDIDATEGRAFAVMFQVTSAQHSRLRAEFLGADIHLRIGRDFPGR